MVLIDLLNAELPQSFKLKKKICLWKTRQNATNKSRYASSIKLSFQSFLYLKIVFAFEQDSAGWLFFSMWCPLKSLQEFTAGRQAPLEGPRQLHSRSGTEQSWLTELEGLDIAFLAWQSQSSLTWLGAPRERPKIEETEAASFLGQVLLPSNQSQSLLSVKKDLASLGKECLGMYGYL